MAQVKSYRYAVVDVFTTEPLAGNPLAVFPDASEFDERTMQKIARELNLTETAFVLPATREDCVAACAFFRQQKSCHLPAIPQLALRLCCCRKGSSREIAVSSVWKRG